MAWLTTRKRKTPATDLPPKPYAPKWPISSALQLFRDVLIVRLLVATVMFRRHVGMHVSDHHDDALLRAVAAVHGVVVAPVPRDHLSFLPLVSLIRNYQLRAPQP